MQCSVDGNHSVTEIGLRLYIAIHQEALFLVCMLDADVKLKSPGKQNTVPPPPRLDVSRYLKAHTQVKTFQSLNCVI